VETGQETDVRDFLSFLGYPTLLQSYAIDIFASFFSALISDTSQPENIAKVKELLDKSKTTKSTANGKETWKNNTLEKLVAILEPDLIPSGSRIFIVGLLAKHNLSFPEPLQGPISTDQQSTGNAAEPEIQQQSEPTSPEMRHRMPQR
jgi:hypothetical protein